MSNIFPEKIVKSTKTSSGFFTEVYSLEAWSNLTLIKFILIILVFFLVLPFVSMILLLMFCHDMNRTEKPYGLLIISLLGSLYLLFDIANNFIVSTLISLFYNIEKLHSIVYLNMSVVLTSLILIFFSDEIFKICGSKRRLAAAFIAITLFLGYHLSIVISKNLNIFN